MGFFVNEKSGIVFELLRKKFLFWDKMGTGYRMCKMQDTGYKMQDRNNLTRSLIP